MSSRPKRFWQKYAWVGVALLCLAVYFCLQTSWLTDTLKGWAYSPSDQMAEIEESLDLTDAGRRIFRATWPEVEGSDEFNAHCNSYDEEVALLGCYTDGQIYIYEITLEQLTTANKVTAAHELLHATWERMSTHEQEQVKTWLTEVEQTNPEWVRDELEVYPSEERMEEIYARAGTKLAELPDGLEEHYAKYFRNRAQIVQFYRDYEAPFLVLQLEMEELAEQISLVNQEIETEREAYLQDLANLDTKIDQFNACAETAGCFASQTTFNARRQALLAERENLEQVRTNLNDKIAQNNQRVEDYQARQAQLGELSNAMNSNVQIMETVK